MPLYAFRCDHCGPFEERRPFARAHEPARCPVCDEVGHRVLTAPGLYRTSPGLRRALSAEEQSAHEPAVVTRPAGGFPGRPVHLHGNHVH